MKNDFRKDEDFMFDEEIPEIELYDKKNQNDVVYVQSSEYKVRIRILIVLAVILIILAVISALFGFIYLDKDIKNQEGADTSITRYDIFVSHSNSSYGGNIKSFKNYDSSTNAFSYSLKVSNENPVDIDYKVEVIDNNYDGNENVLNLISYSLVSNNIEIASGNFENNEVNVIKNVTIKSNSSDNLILKVWSDKVNDAVSFSFKVNISV